MAVLFLFGVRSGDRVRSEGKEAARAGSRPKAGGRILDLPPIVDEKRRTEMQALLFSSVVIGACVGSDAAGGWGRGDGLVGRRVCGRRPAGRKAVGVRVCTGVAVENVRPRNAPAKREAMACGPVGSYRSWCRWRHGCAGRGRPDLESEAGSGVVGCSNYSGWCGTNDSGRFSLAARMRRTRADRSGERGQADLKRGTGPVIAAGRLRRPARACRTCRACRRWDEKGRPGGCPVPRR